MSEIQLEGILIAFISVNLADLIGFTCLCDGLAASPGFSKFLAPAGKSSAVPTDSCLTSGGFEVGATDAMFLIKL